MQESEVERYLVKQVKRNGGWALKLVSPGVSGVPDRLVLMPMGWLVFVEVKRPGGTPRPLQAAVHRRLKGLGFDVITIDCKEDVDDLMDYIGRSLARPLVGYGGVAGGRA